MMQWLDHAGRPLAYIVQGQGPLVILVHGLGASMSDWRFQVAPLAERLQVATVDLPGFGDSPPPAHAPAVDDYAAAVEALADALSPDAPVSLVGHSMGGAVVVQAALRRPHRYHRLVVANSLPSFQPERWRERLEVMYRRVVMRVLGPARLARLSAFRMFPFPDQEDLRAAIIARGLRNRADTYLQALNALTRWNALPRLSELRMPVLLLASEHDYFVRARTEQYAAALSDVRLQWFEGARHGLPMERPAAFNRALLDFLT
jgi:3-oxoadipate enol-lactonase